MDVHVVEEFPEGVNQKRRLLVEVEDMTSIMSSFLRMDVSSQESKEAGGNTLPIMSSLLQRFDYGKVGAKIPLIANYYEIKINHKIYVHRYEVIIKDPAKDRPLDRDVCRSQFWEIAGNDLETFGKLENLIYNDVNCLWVKEKLNLPNDIGRKKIVKTTSRGDERVAYIVEMKYVNYFLVDLAMDFDDSRNVSIQFLNALLTQNIRCPLR
ncbi:unnamed protein product [Onchocerca flexuosa]|uniref:RNA-directed RNA polymerase n=1 Tax=Onchocerca flexuosa TaxID=387005 RepID=A0A183HCY5_9BILA|nr:unnamed protein product [Onchocerca flexuosa]